MYKLTNEEGQCFLTVQGVPVTASTCLLYMERYGEVPDGFDLSVIFDYLREDKFTTALMVSPPDIDVPGWTKVGSFQDGDIWSTEVCSAERKV